MAPPCPEPEDLAVALAASSKVMELALRLMEPPLPVPEVWVRRVPLTLRLLVLRR